MIYMVDHVFADPAVEPAWHAWYSAYLRKLVAVPGLHTAQRFKAIGCTPRYLAMYSIDSADVYASDAYRNMGGGGSQSAAFHHAYALWTRNLFDRVGRSRDDRLPPVWAPVVREGERVLVFDSPTVVDNAVAGSAMAQRLTWLEAVGLHRTTRFRAYVVLAAGESVPEPALPASYVYEPYTKVVTGPAGVPH
jgi:hypothetical protein